jgi:hypothetical protein
MLILFGRRFRAALDGETPFRFFAGAKIAERDFSPPPHITTIVYLAHFAAILRLKVDLAGE